MWFLRDEWLYMHELFHVLDNEEYLYLTEEDKAFYIWRDEDE